MCVDCFLDTTAIWETGVADYDDVVESHCSIAATSLLIPSLFESVCLEW